MVDNTTTYDDSPGHETHDTYDSDSGVLTMNRHGGTGGSKGTPQDSSNSDNNGGESERMWSRHDLSSSHHESHRHHHHRHSAGRGDKVHMTSKQRHAQRRASLQVSRSFYRGELTCIHILTWNS